MEKKKIINISLIIISSILALTSISLLAFSIYSLLTFFVYNSNEFQRINFESNKEITLFNPSMLNIEDLSINLNLEILNKTYNVINVKNISISSNYPRTIVFEAFNSSQIQQELINFSYKLFQEGKNENEIRSILENEISKSKLFGNIEINIQNLLKVSFFLEMNLSKILKLS